MPCAAGRVAAYLRTRRSLTALAHAYQTAARRAPTYTDPAIAAGGTFVRDIAELRAAVRALGQ